MNKKGVKTLFAMALSIGLLGSCQTNSNKQQNIEGSVKETVVSEVKNIPFVVADKYFLKNTVKEIGNPKITTKEDFDNLFGAAAIMGSNGLPTEIDFTKQYVIVVTKPETDQDTRLTPVSLQLNEQKKLVFSYSVKTGDKQSFQIKPCLIIIVDKDIAGDVVLKEVQ